MADFSEMHRFAARLRDFPAEARPLIKGLMNDVGNDAVRMAQGIVPVKTGNLQNSIGVRPTSEHGWTLLMKFAATADYATFVEEGTSRMPPRPFMRPAIEWAVDQMDDVLGMIAEEYL